MFASKAEGAWWYAAVQDAAGFSAASRGCRQYYIASQNGAKYVFQHK